MGGLSEFSLPPVSAVTKGIAMTSVLHRQRTAHDHPTVTAHRGVSILGHVGLAARGVLYVLLGYLALRIAFGVSTSTANRKGALQTIAHQPYGAFLLGAM